MRASPIAMLLKWMVLPTLDPRRPVLERSGGIRARLWYVEASESL